MKKKRRRVRIAAIAIILSISIGNYSQIIGTENIRSVELISIFTIAYPEY